MSNFYDMRVNIALILGLVFFLCIFVPSAIKTHRISKIVKYGKKNNTFIVAKRVSMKHRKNHTEQGTEDDYVGDYEYEVDGKVKKLRVTYGYPPMDLAMYYYKDKRDVHSEREIHERWIFFPIAVIAAIAVGVIFMLLTN